MSDGTRRLHVQEARDDAAGASAPPKAARPVSPDVGARSLEGHPVRRACGHCETLYISRPWAYIDSVAALLPCAICRRKGVPGLLETRENGSPLADPWSEN